LKEFVNNEELITFVNNTGVLPENPEKYVKSKSCWCLREVPQLYSKNKLASLQQSVAGAGYSEIENVCKELKEFDMKQVVDIFYRNGQGFTRKEFISTTRLRDYIYCMVCQGKIKTSLIEFEIDIGKKGKKEKRFKEMFVWLTDEGILCEFRISQKRDKCIFNFRKDGKRRTKPC
jgi:hypothetical protein